MAEMKMIKPAKPGLIIKDPYTLRPIDAAGTEVEIALPYWQRRLRDGDVILVEASVEKTKEPITASEKKAVQPELPKDKDKE